jgi:hypothetical protein
MKPLNCQVDKMERISIVDFDFDFDFDLDRDSDHIIFKIKELV